MRAADSDAAGGFWSGLSLGRKQVVWAWTFLAVPVLFYAVIRFWPTLQAFYLSVTDWSVMRPASFVGLDELPAPRRGSAVLAGLPEHLRVPADRHPDQPRPVFRHRLLPRPGSLPARAHPRPLLPALSHHRRRHGLGVAVVLPACPDRPHQRLSVDDGHRAAALPAFDHAGPACRACPRDLGRSRLPDHHLPGGTARHPDHLLRGRAHRRTLARERSCAGSRFPCSSRLWSFWSFSRRSGSCESSTRSTTSTPTIRAGRSTRQSPWS